MNDIVHNTRGIQKNELQIFFLVELCFVVWALTPTKRDFYTVLGKPQKKISYPPPPSLMAVGFFFIFFLFIK